VAKAEPIAWDAAGTSNSTNGRLTTQKSTLFSMVCHTTVPLSQSGQVTVFAVNRLTWSRNHRQHNVGPRLRRKAISYRHIGSVKDHPTWLCLVDY